MAVSFTGTRIGDWTYKRGTLSANFHTVETQTSDMVCGRVCYGYGNGIMYYFQFYASPAMTYAQVGNIPTAVFTGDLEAATQNTSMFATKPPEAQWIDSVTKDDTTPRNITNKANLVPWFNFTNATLYQKLKELYPTYNSFAYITSAGALGTLVPNPYSAGLNSNYNYASGAADDGFCNNAPGVSSEIPSDVYGTTGTGYDGNPSELTGNWSSADALGAYILLCDPIPDYKVKADMYFEGTDSPNIDIVWKCYKNNQEINPATDDYLNNSTIHIRSFAAASDMVTVEDLFDHVDEETGLRVISEPRSDNQCVDWDLPLTNTSYIHTMFNTIADQIARTYTTADKILYYGVTGKPAYLVWLFQIKEQGNEDGPQVSELWRLREPRTYSSLYPDHTLTEFTDGKSTYSKVDLEVVLHTGSNHDGEDEDDDDDDDDDDDSIYPVPPDPDPWDDQDGVGFPGHAVLTKTYSMTKAITANVGSKLWSQSYFDVLKIQSNPIENIVSVKWFPFNLNDGTDTEIKVGDVAFGINGKLISSIKVIDIGSVTYNGHYGNFLDCSPYTTLKLHLPYIGIVQLDAGDFRGTTISVKYIVDLITGECMARVLRDGIPYEDYTGHMGVDIPLTSSDRVQTEMKALTSGIHTGAALAGNLISGDVAGAVAGAATGALSIAGMDYSTQRSGAPSSACGSYQNHAVWLEVMYPQYYMSSGFSAIFGRPVNQFLTLRGNFSDGDFVQVDKRAKISIAMTGEENAELEQLLTEGVFI